MAAADPVSAAPPLEAARTADMRLEFDDRSARMMQQINVWRDELIAWFKTLFSAAIYATLIVTFGFQVARVEGLSMAPGSTNAAYIGFRAPLVPPTNRANALIVPVNNFTTLASAGGPPGTAVFGEPIQLNLGCRGIRSIEGHTNGYLLVVGPPGPATGVSPADFRLFTWTGYATNTPQERAADLSGLNPEGIVEVPTFCTNGPPSSFWYSYLLTYVPWKSKENVPEEPARMR